MKKAYVPYVHGAVRLRMLAEDDLRATLAWRNRDGVRQQFKNPDLLEWESHERWFVRYREKLDDIVFIVERLATGEKVGQVAIYSIDTVKRTAEIGRFVVSPEFQGQGLMREGIATLMRFAATELGLNSVYLEVVATNSWGRGLYQSLGFVEKEAVDGLIRMERSIDDYV